MTKEAPNTSFMIVTVDPEKGTVGFYSAVCKQHEDKKFSAVDWMKKAASVCGGKGGGKAKLAQGQVYIIYLFLIIIRLKTFQNIMKPWMLLLIMLRNNFHNK